MPAQPCWVTVLTSWPVSSRARRRGSCSSSRTRTARQRLMSRLQRRDNLLARDAWKIIEKLVKGVSFLDVIDQVAQRHPRSQEHRRAPENLRVAMNH